MTIPFVPSVGGQEASALLVQPPTANAVARKLGDKIAEKFSPDDCGAKGDGQTVDSAAFTKCIADAAGREIVLTEGKTYVLDDNFEFENLRSDNATIKLADSTTLGDISFITITAGGTLKGTLTIDGNRANNTQVIYSLALKGGGHTVDTVIANDVNGMGHRGFDCSKSVIQDLRSDNCAAGSWLSFNNSSGFVGSVECLNLNADQSNLFQHAVDILEADRVFIGSIRVEEAAGNTTGPSTALTALLLQDVHRTKIAHYEAKNFLSSLLTPLAFSAINCLATTVDGIRIEGWEGARQIELKNCRDCTIRNAWVYMKYNTGRGAGGAANNTGIFNANGSTMTNPSGNIFENITIINGNLGVRDGGFGNIYRNVRTFGAALDGFSFISINESTQFPDIAANYGQLHGGHIMQGCVAKGAGASGLYMESNMHSLQAQDCDFSGNGTDTARTTNRRAGVHYTGAANPKIRLRNCKLADDYQDFDASYGLEGVSADSSQNYDITDDFPVTLIEGSAGFYPGQIIELQDAILVGSPEVETDVEFRINFLDEKDEALLIADDGSTGTLQTHQQIPTGTNVAGTAGQKTLTGTGTLFTSEIKGRAWWFFQGVAGRYQVTQVDSDTSLEVEPAFASTFSISALRLVSFNLIAQQRQQYGYYGNYITMVDCEVYGNAQASQTNGIPAGITEVGTVVVGGSTSATYTYKNVYPSAPIVVVTPIDGTAGLTWSVGTPGLTSCSVYNAAGTSKTYNVMVMG